MLTAVYNMLTNVDNAHTSGKCSQLWIMLTGLENAHISAKYSQVWKMLTSLQNAHKSGKCSHLCKMLTSLENAHISEKCSQVWKKLTSLGSAYLYTEYTHMFIWTLTVACNSVHTQLKPTIITLVYNRFSPQSPILPSTNFTLSFFLKINISRQLVVY